MCRKDFTGYKCGHCSLPKITPCPLTWTNPLFPLCTFIAEFVKPLESYCEPCQRAVFTHGVLLQEKDHAESHRNHACNCGFDYTEEERERRRAAKLTQENAGKKDFSRFEGHVSSTGQLGFQASEEIGKSYKRFNTKENGLLYKSNMEKYMNAPYGRHPLLPVSVRQDFRPNQPRYSFASITDRLGAQAASVSPYCGHRIPFQHPTDMTMATDPMRNFLVPYTIDIEKENDVIPDQVSAEDQEKNLDENQEETEDVENFSSVNSAFDANVESILGFTSPADVSNPFISSPLTPRNVPIQGHEEDWDTRSM